MPVRTTTIDAKIVKVLDNLLVTAVDELGRYRVLSPQDAASLLGFDKMKQAAGCDDLSCAAEFAGALGSRFLLSATLDALGSKLVLTAALTDSEKVVVVKRSSIEVPNDPDVYSDGIHKLVVKTFDADLDLKDKPTGAEDSNAELARACFAKEAQACEDLRQKGLDPLGVAVATCSQGDEESCAAITNTKDEAVVVSLYQACINDAYPACVALTESGLVNEIPRPRSTLFWSGIGLMIGSGVVSAGGILFGILSGDGGSTKDLFGALSGTSLSIGGVGLVTASILLLIDLVSTSPAEEVQRRVDKPFFSVAPMLGPQHDLGLTLTLTFPTSI